MVEVDGTTVLPGNVVTAINRAMLSLFSPLLLSSFLKKFLPWGFCLSKVGGILSCGAGGNWIWVEKSVIEWAVLGQVQHTRCVANVLIDSVKFGD